MPRLISTGLRAVLDIVALSIAYWLAFLFRFEFSLPTAGLNILLVNWPYVTVVHYMALTAFGIPRMSWRYTTMRDTIRILLAVIASTAVLVVLRLVLAWTGEHIIIVPLSVLAMQFVLAFVGLVGIRAAWRIRGEVHDRTTSPPTYPFIPVVAMPSINVFCARKNSTIIGAMTRSEAAISKFHCVPPCCD